MIRVDFEGMLVEITTRANAKKLTLSYHPEEQRFSMTVPAGSSRCSHIAFLEQNRAWMQERIAAQGWQPSYAAGERHLLWGTYEPLGGAKLPVGEAALHQAYVRALTAEVARILPELKRTMRLQVTQITLKDMRTRWGSCQPQCGHISLNLRLARLPKKYTYYVLAHEMCHMLHADHSPAFYAALERFCPEAPQMRETIKQEPLAPQPPL